MNTVQEEWRQVKGYEGSYEVSSIGRIRSVERVIVCFGHGEFAIAKTMRGRVLKQTKHNGYYAVTLSKVGKKPKRMLVHRALAQAFICETNDLEVNHMDGN